MYATGESVCPVKSFKMYVSKLNPALFQRPKKNSREDAESLDVWYDNQVVGLKTLTTKTKVISVRAGLLRVYTNHSIRAMSVTILDKCGFEACHIMSVSGHRQAGRRYQKLCQNV